MNRNLFRDRATTVVVGAFVLIRLGVKTYAICDKLTSVDIIKKDDARNVRNVAGSQDNFSTVVYN